MLGQDLPPADFWANRKWNEKGKPELSSWLCQTQSREDKLRLQTLGNIVVPQQGFLGASVLFKMVNGEHFA